MKSKFNKYLKYVAAAVFITTLAINVAITLDDPFVLLSDEAIATTTSSSSSSSTGTKFTIIFSHSKTYTNGVLTWERELQVCDPNGFYDCEPFCRERYDREGGGVLTDWVDC